MTKYLWKTDLWETGSNILELKNRKGTFLGSFLDEEINEVLFHFEDFRQAPDLRWCLTIGVCDGSSEDNSSRFGVGNNGWGITDEGRITNRYSSSSSLKRVFPKKRRIRPGSTIKMTFNRSKKTLSYVVDGTNLGVLFKKVDGGESGKIRIAITCGAQLLRVRVENVGSRIPEYYFPEDEMERFLFLHNIRSNNDGIREHQMKYPSFQISLKNKNLEIWKPFLLFSNISEDEYTTDKLSHLHLEVDEVNIHSILLSKPTSIHSEALMDYFLFFKHLGMKYQMLAVISKLHREMKKPGFKMRIFLEKTIDRYEPNNEKAKSWLLSSSENNLLEASKPLELFENSFSYFVYYQMFFNMKKKRFGDMFNILGHPDFYNDTLNHDLDISKREFLEEILQQSTSHLIRTLWDTKKLYNVVLKTREGGIVHAHREILILKFNFFYRMIKFGGRESESLKEQGEIFVEDFGKDDLETLLEYAYTGFVNDEEFKLEEEKELRTFFKLYFHSEKYMEKKLMLKCHQVISSFFENNKRKNTGFFPNEKDFENVNSMRSLADKIIHEFGLELVGNQNVGEKIMYLFEKMIEDYQIKDMYLVNDVGGMVMKSSILRLKEKVEDQNEVIKDQRDKINAQELEIEDLKKRMEKIEVLMRKK